LFTSVTPEGRVPVTVKVGAGTPRPVIVTVPGVPTVKLALGAGHGFADGLQVKNGAAVATV